MITIRDMISNISKGQSSISIKYILAALNQYYDENKQNIEIIHCGTDHDSTRIHCTLPSSSRPIKYDVVFDFHTLGSKIDMSTQFQVFSNSPDFGFTFAYVYNQQNALLYPEKYPREMIINAPDIRNPYKTKGFSKIVYSAMKYCASKDLNELRTKFLNTTQPEVSTFMDKNR